MKCKKCGKIEKRRRNYWNLSAYRLSHSYNYCMSCWWDLDRYVKFWIMREKEKNEIKRRK